MSLLAHHEAGHVVVGCALGGRCNFVMVRTDRGGATWWLEAPEGLALAATNVAGPIAEWIALHRRQPSGADLEAIREAVDAHSDYTSARRLAEAAEEPHEGYVRKAARVARWTLWRHRRAVEAVAAALMKRSVLKTAAVHRLVATGGRASPRTHARPPR